VPLETLCACLAGETRRYVSPLRAGLNDKAVLAKGETTMLEDQTITMTRRRICVQ
jgi:hypothetical protein